MTEAGVLTVDLGAIAENWRRLRDRAAPAACGAAVKADAYGLGAARVAPALYAAGCRAFFVAHQAEGAALRPLLPADAALHVLHGPAPGAEDEAAATRLTPVLNSLGQIAAWRATAARAGRALPAALQIDVGMARLGLPEAEVAALAADPGLLAGIDLRLIMAHLAVAEAPAHPSNAAALARFRAARARLPAAPASLANSSGLFLGPDYRFDLVRPGAALYGVNPGDGPNPMRPVVGLTAPVVQLRDLSAGEAVGYGWTWTADRPARIATVALGYADGWPRALGNRGCGFFGGARMPVIGRVSMDLITLDASALPPGALAPGAMVDFLTEAHGIDAVAATAGTIGYEILTGLGARFARRYRAG
jgi:alanine racemase